MAMPGMALAGRNFGAIIAQLDAALQEAQDGARVQLLLNRGFCLQQLGLSRKALKDYEEVADVRPGHPAALLNKAKVHVALKQLEEAQACLEELARAAALHDDLAVVLEGQLLAAAITAGSVKQGAKVPLLPAFAPPVPQQAPPAAKPSAAFSAGFLGTSASKPAAAASVSKAAGAPASPPASAVPQPKHVAASSACTGASVDTDGGAGAAAAPPTAAGLDSLHRLLARTDANQGMQLAVQLVNSGKCREAVTMLDLLLHHHPGSVGGYAARGTAHALLGQLKEAVDDFSAAINLEPGFADFVKRRGQALAALGEDERAAVDIQCAIELSTTDADKADGHEMLARLYQKAKDYRRAEAELRLTASLSKNGPSADVLSALGLCQTSQGNLQDGILSYEAALALEPESKDFWLNLGMATKEICMVERAEEALNKAAKLAKRGGTAVHAYRLLAQMKQGLGDHLGAIRELSRGIAASDSETQRVELRFLRGACYHAMGMHREAVEDYQRTLAAQEALEADVAATPELVSFICLAFYQKEMALYVRKNLDRHVHSFCVDADMHPEFKELWCKKGPPSAEFVSMYRLIMQPQQPDWNIKAPQPPPELLGPLIEAADAVGLLVQYRHQGFLPNRRQQRMAGLAAIEFAQTLQQLVADQREGKHTMVDNIGASVSARRGSRSGQHPLGWRDAMDVIVRWRQLAEPNDQVIWVDLLTEKEFNAGFGSHTPMFTGQTKCVRYYMVFQRAMAVLKRVLATERRATDAHELPVLLDTEEKLEAVAAAQTAQDMWQAMGTDCWAVVPIDSSVRPGHTLEGTRLTIVSMCKPTDAGGGEEAAEEAAAGDDGRELALSLGNGVPGAAPVTTKAKRQRQPDAYEFSIRTPVTPARWDDYDEELGGVFERLTAALAAGDLPGMADASLRFAFYWYNFMPLARGSAFCGFVSMLGAFMAAGAPVRSPMPQSYQTDWEAILESSPDNFIASVSAWMMPPEVSSASSSGGVANAAAQGSSGSSNAVPPPPCLPLHQLPRVLDVLPTMRARLEALNGTGAPRI
ncbi:hypothetical protein D9Q98_010190 [Chlorella vulgaris]|uniref:Uncharacterized protein n=1 Tax=Chlorella vulgaris TaxID=3077 RepID=A0A9D4YWK6_CHLVU|nr:hypothetical protein D9Q98_010190 [Chlorella vulgaris]